MYTRKATTLTLALILTSANVYADRAQLMEDCGGHTNYGLQRSPSDTNAASSESAPALTMRTSNKNSKESIQEEHSVRKQNERRAN